MQGTADVPHPIATTHLPLAAAVFDTATALDTALDMVDPQPTLVELLVSQVLLPREFLPQIGINSNVLRDQVVRCMMERLRSVARGMNAGKVTSIGGQVSLCRHCGRRESPNRGILASRGRVFSAKSRGGGDRVDAQQVPVLSYEGSRQFHRPRTIGSKTPRPIANSHSAGAGVPTGRRRRASRAAMRGSSSNHSAWRRSNTRKTTAVAAP